MRFKGFLLLFFGLFCTYSSFAQFGGELTQSRILILLDESSSMIQKWPSGKEKYKAADELILHLMDSIYAINPDVEFSLRVFGHQHTVEENNCYDTKNEVPFSKDNRVQMSLRLEDIRPLGVTPISFALLQAAKFDLVDEEHNAYSIILLTDGGESCGGDICEVMKKLMKYKVYFKPYIVSLEDDPALKTTYSCMGDFLQVTKDADMPRAVSTIVNAFRPAIKITKTDYKELQTLAANAPSALKVNIPIIKPGENSPKKESEEIPVTKPVKTFKDTTSRPVVKETPPLTKDTVTAPKPVTKIKIDEPVVKPQPVSISRVVAAHSNLLFTPVPVAKVLNTVPVYTPEIIVLPPAENITAVNPVSPRLFNYILPAAHPMSFIALLPMPPIEPPVTIIQEKITHLSLSSPITVAIAAPHTAKITTVELLPMPPIEPPVTITPEMISHLSLSSPIAVAITTPHTTKITTVDLLPMPPIEPPVTIIPDVITHLSLSSPVTVAITTPHTAKITTVDLLPMPAIEAPVTITAEKINHLSLSSPVTVAVTTPRTKKITTVALLPMPPIEIPATINPESIAHIAATKPHPLNVVELTTQQPKVRPLLPLPPMVIDTPVAPKPVYKIERLRTASLRPSNIIFVIEDKAFVQRRVPPLPPLKIDIPKTPIAKTTEKDNSIPFKKADYTVNIEDAKETTVEIYLTNGHGKVYTSTPQMLLLEPGTNKVVKTFYRTVDAAGNPDPIDNIPPGTYNIALSVKRSIGLKNVKIEPNKKTKVTVTVLPASLSFAYEKAPDRPITEFVARVTERNKAQGRVQDQKCTAALEYEAGNYHIMINTLPQIDRNVDLDFEETIIMIPQPGFVKFIFPPQLHTAVLYKQEGDKFSNFYTVNLSEQGDQPLRLQPGEYQVHYHKGPGGPSASEKVGIFFVKATQTTTVDLN